MHRKKTATIHWRFFNPYIRPVCNGLCYSILYIYNNPDKNISVTAVNHIYNWKTIIHPPALLFFFFKYVKGPQPFEHQRLQWQLNSDNLSFYLADSRLSALSSGQSLEMIRLSETLWQFSDCVILWDFFHRLNIFATVKMGYENHILSPNVSTSN